MGDLFESLGGFSALNRNNMTVYIGALASILGWGLASSGVPEGYQNIVDALPEIIALLTIILAWRFRRSRLVVAAIILALANQLVHGPLSLEIAAGHGPGLSALAILLPLNLGILVMLRDRPVPKLATLMHLVLVLSQPVLVKWLLSIDITSLPASFALIQTPEASLLAFLIAVVFALLALALKRSALEVGMLWVLICSVLALHGDYSATGVSMLFSAAQLTLLLGLVEDSYRLAFHDELTGLPGRRAFNEALHGLSGKFALAMVDIDHFKRFNDRYGHDAGDQALRMVSDCLMRIGGGGRAYRFGGEEFTILFTGNSVDSAKEHLEELRKRIADRRFSIRSKKRPRKKPGTPKKVAASPQAKLTVSMGLAKPNARRSSTADVLSAADKNLYRAKNGGRNRLVL